MRTNDVMLQTATKVVTFIILMFAVHIFFAGHYTPGGGFVGGLLTASAIVLLMLAFDIPTVKKIIPINYVVLSAVGLLIAIATASASIVFDVPFFTHAYDYFDLPLFGETSLHSALLFDIGVYLVVVGVTMTIIQTIGEDE
ncbi:Na(+)/H(+) antiporter subunit B [Planococcus sp. CP5-4]|uniref:Na(+)/H(+) antiporter subunit B n=1 Tax=unclassified Planococcus (in: firmicutes) TaxID=2662419 RepID=UPI001C22EE48|nr:MULTISPECIES: Na(+)/H(+) antiporter subunit B [unclassified Planococcus (in: firmicutes)]MBU9673976.1 Na(+)/H(+) antiporter subunit B [Planococcus sp. CP5-4_YE]MBV0909846.1 Na(+)/H(+) antiporter subunit B [Planococcus sp. CP5-4_UN]MBW6064455.1 Na(+)/H(+) antiporter subunit B [Planococcus sp. CP5-4]